MSAPKIIESFIARWNSSGGAERANYALFLTELCALLDLPAPDPGDGSLGAYRFERGVSRPEPDGSISRRRIDLYKRGCFVLEAKQATVAPQLALFATSEPERRAMIRQTTQWTRAMQQARGQAEAYARDLAHNDDDWPPFLIVCDIGFCFDLYADFSGRGKHYTQFHDANTFRIYLADLQREDVRAMLRAIWLDPMSLDPQRRRTAVTRDIAALLARLAVALEARGHPPDSVATFLMRAIFCMFAQSVGLLPSATAFTDLLHDCHGDPRTAIGLIGDLWRSMNAGGFSAALRADLRRFNGGLFAPGAHGPAEPLPLDADMLALLETVSRRDWANVEPAIFGTLLENALAARERGQLGAHFTPRAFVERLVQPTVMEPLRAQWDAVRALADERAEAGDRPGAADAVRAFHGKLCAVRVLDPACGTGNFLYVTMELMKRLEGEVLDLLFSLDRGEGSRLELAQTSVSPQQFLGLEKNPRAVPVAELVLWIGYLQWHFRTFGAVPPAEPILRDFHNIIHADALLNYTHEETERDESGQLVTRWDGRTFKAHLIIKDKKVPDEAARVELRRPVKPKPTVWPHADYIVGNPPFIAGKDLRSELGDGYAEALWAVYPKVPKSADIAMHFWWKAAQAAVAVKGARRFGFITSNSIRQTFCRRVISAAMEARKKLRLVFAIPDHPWADGVGTAAVRIAMTVGEHDRADVKSVSVLQRVVSEAESTDSVPNVELATMAGSINADLTLGAIVTDVAPLMSNGEICSPGMKLHGAGFIVAPAVAGHLGLGRITGLDRYIRPYLNGRDVTQRSRGMMVIDLDGLTEDQVRRRFPAVYQHVLVLVKPERDQNNEAYRRNNWWLFGRNNSLLRSALAGLPRYIATVETAKHRPFCFLPANVIPDNMLVCIASADAFHLGVLSSRIHVAWSLAAGGTLEDRPRYNKTRCFDPFPFPLATDAQRSTIAAIAEELDATRRTRLDANPQLTLTGLYNVVEKLRANTPLTPEDRDIHDAGHVSVLKTLHDRLDQEVAAAYGWRPDLSAADIVARVVALNATRRAEEERGIVRWLRPEYQAPDAQPAAPAAQQATLDVDAAEDEKIPSWPKEEVQQYIAVRAALMAEPATPLAIASRFRRAPRARLATILDTLSALGQIRKAGDGRYYR